MPNANLGYFMLVTRNVVNQSDPDVFLRMFESQIRTSLFWASGSGIMFMNIFILSSNAPLLNLPED